MGRVVFYELQEALAMLGLNWSAPVLNVLLPVGISFYTFQTLSYTVDIYRGEVKPTQSLLHFATFVAFFPQLVAGPILRASQFLPELTELRSPDSQRAIYGFHRILRALLKKALFADLIVARLVDPVFADPTAFHGTEVLIAAYGYALQVSPKAPHFPSFPPTRPMNAICSLDRALLELVPVLTSLCPRRPRPMVKSVLVEGAQRSGSR